MSTIKQKLAALRAKRASKSTPALPMHSPHLGLDAPHASWDADYKARLERRIPPTKRSTTQLSPCSSEDDDEDEDEDELIVLPPPTRKLSSAAHRQLWRMREIKRAKERNLRRFMENRPEAFESTELCSYEASPDKEDGEEEYGEGDDDDEGEREWEDEEEAALQSAGKLQAEAENNTDVQDNNNGKHVGKVNSAIDSAGAADGSPMDKDGEEEFRPVPLTSGGSLYEAERGFATDSSVKQCNDNTCANDDVASIRASDKPQGRASSQLTRRNEDWSPSIVHENITIKNGNDTGTANYASRSDFIEDEAEDEDANGGEDLSAIPDHHDAISSEVDSSTDEGIDENEISASEKKKLASFHQKWLLNREKEEVNALKADPRKLLDLEDDKPSAKTKIGPSKPVNEVSAKDRDNLSQAAEESAAAELECDNSVQPNNYIETM